MAGTDDEKPWTRQLVVVLVALVGVALVIGGVLSVIALGAARITGLADSLPTATAEPSLYIPSGKPTTRVDPFPDPVGRPRSASPTSRPPSPKPSRKPRAISLEATPRTVAANERITLTGAYRDGAGATLQVQRFEQDWVDFPVTVSVNGGRFSTYVTTGRSGVNRFRMIDPAGRRTSNEVRVIVG